MRLPRFIPELAFVAALSAESRRLFDATATVLTPPRGRVLLRRGDPVTGAYFVLSGVLRVYTLSAAGAESLLYRVEAGEGCLLALNAVFAELRYPAWVSVETKEARILSIPGPVLRQLHEREAGVRTQMFEVLSTRVFDLMTKIEDLSTLSLEERLRSHLLRRADAAGLVYTTHEELAVHLATAREVVSRHLRQLSRAGLIATRRGCIQVLRPEALR